MGCNENITFAPWEGEQQEAIIFARLEQLITFGTLSMMKLYAAKSQYPTMIVKATCAFTR